MNKHRVIYLAYPIDQADYGQREHVVGPVLERVKAEIELRGFGWYDPGAALHTGALVPGDEARKMHHRAQSLCTGTLALLPPGVPSVGVPVEVQKAVTGWGMPTTVIGADGSWGLPFGVQQHAWPHGSNLNDPDIRRTVGEAVTRLLAEQPSNYEQRQDTLPFARVVYLDEPDLPSTPKLPTRVYPDDAGLDLYVSEDVTVPPGDFRDIPTGLGVELPEHCWAYLTGRSSTLRKLNLLVNPGVIDAGYRGELFAGVWNLGSMPVTVRTGDRLAQLIVMSNSTRMYRPTMVDKLTPHDRGVQGFGSSGK